MLGASAWHLNDEEVVQSLQTLIQHIVLHCKVEKIDDFRVVAVRMHENEFFACYQHDIVEEQLILRIVTKRRCSPRVGTIVCRRDKSSLLLLQLIAAASCQCIVHRIDHQRYLLVVENHIRIAAILQYRECQLVDAQNVCRHASHILHHLHYRLQIMLRRGRAVETVLEQQQQNIFDEVEVRSLLIITIDAYGEVFAHGEDEYVQWREI